MTSVIPPPPSSLPQRPAVQAPPPRQERTIRDIHEAKAVRKAEIERRCMELDPSIPPNILAHMDAFQAALQITTPMTSNAWEMLKPRLLAQRETAEKAESARLEQSRLLLARMEDPNQHEPTSRGSRETSERDWEALQTPIRESLGRYADQFIQTEWSGGHILTKEKCPDFAASTLIHSFTKYYEELASKKTMDPTAPAPKLVLENMKWIFDNKIRGLTERFQKEIFLCNGCTGNSNKQYGFEAVIQHYAAKHTSTLSQGSVIVYWRAEWPEETPFHPHPGMMRAELLATPKSTIVVPVPQNVQPPPAEAVGTYGQAYPPANRTAEPSQFMPMVNTEPSSGFYMGSPAPPYQAQRAFQPPPQPAYAAPQESHVVQGTYLTSPAQVFGFQPPPQPHQGPAPGFPYSNYAAPAAYQPNYFPINGNQPPVPASNFDLYPRQMADMARIAREVWFAIQGVKDMPQSVRIYVVIQHVVTRFEKLYTNEPSLAMFIDGLDHNSQMRPVRSLNGLACKACVAKSQTSDASHPAQALNDRRLFTLPLLLNHFRTFHLERARPSVDVATGMESSRLDWKRDMIELPDPHIIRDLVNAEGMDMKKFHLVAPVFPGILSDADDSGSSPGIKVEPEPVMRDFRQQGLMPDSHGSYSEVSSRHDPAGSRPYSSVGHTNSRSSPGGSPEPAAEHEYDPNRPSDFGKIIESRQVSHVLPKSSNVSSIDFEERRRDAQAIVERSDPAPDSRLSNQGAYSSQLLRHRSDKKVARDDRDEEVLAVRSGRASASQFEHSDPVGDTAESSPKGTEDEADRFLSGIKQDSSLAAPEEGQDAHYEQLRHSDVSRNSAHLQSSSSMNEPRIVTLVEASPSNRQQMEYASVDRPAVGGPSHQVQAAAPYHRTSSPRIFYIRDDRERVVYRERSPPPYDVRQSNRITYLGNGSVEQERSWAEQPRPRVHSSPGPPHTPKEEPYSPAPATTYQRASPRAVRVESGTHYIVPVERSSQGEWRHEESMRAQPQRMEYIQVRREDYDAPRYYVAARAPERGERVEYRPEGGYEAGPRYAVVYPEERRSAGHAPRGSGEIVEYREHR